MIEKQPHEVVSNSEEETKNIAMKLAGQDLPSPICLYGNLGSGKSIFAKGFARYFGIDEKKVKSPTFAFIREYTLLDKVFSHCDFYRLEEVDEILQKQLEEAYEKGPVIIEWADRILDLPDKRTDIYIEYINQNKRKIKWKIKK